MKKYRNKETAGIVEAFQLPENKEDRQDIFFKMNCGMPPYEKGDWLVRFFIYAIGGKTTCLGVLSNELFEQQYEELKNDNTTTNN